MSKTINKTIILVAAGVLLLGVWGTKQLAQAETVETTRSTRVMSRPGEKSRVVTRLDSGTALRVLAKKGRWYKVRAGGRTGWVKRTSVASTRAARESVRKTRRRPFVKGRSTRRGWSGSAPDDRVGADAVEEEIIEEEGVADDEEVALRERDGRVERDVIEEDDEMVVVVAEETDLMAKPSTRSASVLTVEPGNELFVLRESQSGSWILVENADGDAGWIRSDEIDESSGYRYPEETIKRAGARIGYATIGSQFASDGMGELANYSISSAAATLSVGGELLYKYSDKYMLAADGRYTGMRSNPGIRYVDGQGNAADIAFLQHDIDVGAAVGYNLEWDNGAVIYGRLGYHYGKFDVQEVDNFDVNIAYLPSEILSGITVGAHVDVPKFKEKYAVHLGADAIYPSGTLEQTVGLEDGQTASVFGLWGIARVTYDWKEDYKLQGMYRYGLQEIEWVGQATDSMRPHNATEAARKDVSHSLFVGIGKIF